MSEHSKYSPSQLSRIIACPGSISLAQALDLKPKPAGDAAQRGTYLHELVDKCFIHAEEDPKVFDADLSIDDRTQVIDCIEYFNTVLASFDSKKTHIHSEVRVSLKDWGVPEVYGTMDRGVFNYSKGEAHIFDWKFGYNFVGAEDNSQLMAYAAGFIQYPTPIRDIYVHIVQPPIDNYWMHHITFTELYEWVHGTLAIAIQNSKSSAAKFNPSKTNCQWCPCVSQCDAHYNWVNENASRIFELNGLLPKYATHEKISELLDQAHIVDGAIKAYYKHMYNDLMCGITVPGKKLVRGRGTRKWKDEQAAISFLTENIEDIDDLFVSKLVSPAQAEKLNKVYKKDPNFKKLIDKTDGPLKMADEKDPRPAVTVEDAASSVFSKYANPDK